MDQFFAAFEETVPVAVDLRRNAESLIDFVQLEDALYVFGPDQGELVEIGSWRRAVAGV